MSAELTIGKEHKINGKSLSNIKFELERGVDMNRLIGAPHLFGRFFHTREGFLIVPIGVMTLQPDGRVTGYSHPNEGSWINYEHGTVGADKAFAFVTSHNNWIPSSTWQQSLGDIPIGYFCDEPEIPQKLCLIPHKPSHTKPSVVYLVASCLRFYEQTVPKLLKDLFEEGIEPERIKVTVNGCARNEDKIINGVSMHSAPIMHGNIALCMKRRCAGILTMAC